MIDMMQRVAGSGREALPEAVLIAAPIEAILSLFMYGACAGILGAQRAGQATGGAAAESEVAYDLQIGLLVVKIIVTLLVALALAHVFAIFLGARTILKWPLKPTADQGASQSAKPRAFFTGSAPEEVLLVLSMAIIAYALNCTQHATSRGPPCAHSLRMPTALTRPVHCRPLPASRCHPCAGIVHWGETRRG